MHSPETTPLHEAIEALPTALANGVTFALVFAMLIGGTLYVAHAIRQTRARTYSRQLDARIHRTTSQRLNRSDDYRAPREWR